MVRRDRHIHFSSSRIPSGRGRSVYEREWMRKRHHLLQQVPGKHFSLLQRQTGSGVGVRVVTSYLVQKEVQMCVRAESASVHVAEVADWLVLHDAQVVHGTAEGDLDGLADAGCSSFHHFNLVYGLVYPQRNHLGSRKPLPEGENNTGVTSLEKQQELNVSYDCCQENSSDSKRETRGHCKNNENGL